VGDAPAGGFRVRPARAEDLPAALELFGQLDRFQEDWRVFEPRRDLAGEAEARYLAALEDPAELHLVAQHIDRLVGMGLARILVPSSISDERGAEVSNVYVRPDARGLGIGRALVTELARWSRERGARRLVVKTYTQNEEALRFWEALRFRPRYVQMTALAEDLAKDLAADRAKDLAGDESG
jgi:ribosomal protein S18 acetylase RimI-like enzyme